MKNLIATTCMAIGALGFSAVSQAGPAASIAEGLNMTINTTPGGVLHSQARTIFSFGGGMVTAQGKKISLMAVDPPGFSAGCGGISWHFGGFAFISAQEIRQLIEAVSQAALGVVIDLAMQTLCPQCHAVISQMRALANAARAMIADSCRIAKGLAGNLLKETGIFEPENMRTECGSKTASTGKTDGILAAQFDKVCDTMQSVSDTLSSFGADVNKWLDGGNAALAGAQPGAKRPSNETMQTVGNMTYNALGALGFPDGFAKDIILSSIGMSITPAKDGKDCTDAFTNLKATPKSEEDKLSITTASQNAAASNDSSKSEEETPDEATAEQEKKSDTPPPIPVTDAKTGKLLCYAPPLLNNTVEVGKRLICGFDMKKDLDKFANAWAESMGYTVDGFKQKMYTQPVGVMCNLAPKSGKDPSGAPATDANGAPVETVTSRTPSDENPFIYQCKNGCLQPKMLRLKDALTQTGTGTDSDKYSGVVWYVMDALYKGVAKVAAGDQGPLDPETVAILTNSDYPLFRVMNLAAVYSYTASNILEAYSAAIATNHVEATLNRMLRPGAMPHIQLKSVNGLSRPEIYGLREQIDAMADKLGTINSKTMARLSEKQAIIEQLVQINKSIQAELITTGLSSNGQLAVSLKKQVTNDAATKATAAKAAAAAANNP